MPDLQKQSPEKNESAKKFLPSRPSALMLWLVHNISKVDMHKRNRVIISPEDLERLRSIPQGKGMVLTPNHADEMDPRVCFEVSRRSKQRFIFMCNREAFSEWLGFAGWGLQRIGAFSVERGGHDTAALNFAVQSLMASKETLVIFPEGEIFYLSESLQPFHSGAIEIGIKAIIERRKQEPDYTAYLLPMCIKYCYLDPINDILESKIQKMEEHLAKGMTGFSIESRLEGVMAEIIRLKEKDLDIAPDQEHFSLLAERLKNIRHTLLSKVATKHEGSYSAQARTIDQSFQLAAKVREQLARTQSHDHIGEYQSELSELDEVKHLASIHPGYMEADPSPERLAELVIKLERELYNVKRPVQMGRREVHVKIGEPINLADYLDEYHTEPHVVRHKLAERLRSEIQGFIDSFRKL